MDLVTAFTELTSVLAPVELEGLRFTLNRKEADENLAFGIVGFLHIIQCSVKGEYQTNKFQAAREKLESLEINDRVDAVRQILGPRAGSPSRSAERPRGFSGVLEPSNIENPESLSSLGANTTERDFVPRANVRGVVDWLTLHDGSQISIDEGLAGQLVEVLQNIGDDFVSHWTNQLSIAGGNKLHQLSSRSAEAQSFFEHFRPSLEDCVDDYPGNKSVIKQVIVDLDNLDCVPSKFAHVRTALRPFEPDIPNTDHIGEDEPNEEWPAGPRRDTVESRAFGED
ncbi:MAG: hypothetical protein SGILL_009788 [Bacillariaceae sp.]